VERSGSAPSRHGGGSDQSRGSGRNAPDWLKGEAVFGSLPKTRETLATVRDLEKKNRGMGVLGVNTIAEAG